MNAKVWQRIRLLSIGAATAIVTLGIDVNVAQATTDPNLGDFHIQCNIATTGTFDPIAMPHATNTHLHLFFGNKGINKDSDDTLLGPTDTWSSSKTTCPTPRPFTDPYWAY